MFQILSTPFLGLIYNTDITVDGFFGLSGIVLSYYLLEFLENSNGLKIFPLIFKRFIRFANNNLHSFEIISQNSFSSLNYYIIIINNK